MRSLLLSFSVALAFHTHAAPASNISDRITQAANYQSGLSIEPLRQLEKLVANATSDPTLRAQLEVGLIQLLAPSATFEARKFACEQLAIVGSETALPALATLLNDPDTVAIACLALSENPSPRANDLLRDALPAASGTARLQILHALGNRQDRQAVELLTEHSRHPDPATAEAAIIALGKIADPAARRTLETLRREAHPSLAPAVNEALLQAAEQLVATGNPRAALRIYQSLLIPPAADPVRRGALEALFALDRDAGEKRILAVLRGSDAVLKPVAIAGIIALPRAQASQRFGRELPALEPQEQVLLVAALAARADTGALQVIRTQVGNPHEPVRIAAIQALGQFGDPADVPLLTRALSTAVNPPERVAIERALTGLPGGQATDRALIDALQTAPDNVKPHLIASLAQRRSQLAVPALLEHAGSPTPAVARAAFQALSRLATASNLPALLDRLAGLQAAAARSDAETAVVRALLQVQPVDHRWELLQSRLDPAADLETQLSLLRLLPHAPVSGARATLETAVLESNPQIADVALRALADWPDLAAWESLARVYHGETAEAHRMLALRALVRLARDASTQPDSSLIQRYRELFDGARRDEDRKLILGALGGVAHPDALALALSQLERPAVRPEAQLAVRQIAESIKEQHPDAAQTALQHLQD
jgi:HEAT repeat protein